MFRWLRRVFRRGFKLSRDSTEYPVGTPLWGVCSVCGDVLTYPPITIASMPIPSSKKTHVYTIQWFRYCKLCAVRKLNTLTEWDIVPDHMWCLRTSTVISNPFKLRRNNAFKRSSGNSSGKTNTGPGVQRSRKWKWDPDAS